MQLDNDTLAGLRKLLADHDASQEATASKDADAEPDWGLGGILHLILDHIHVREDLREKAHAAVEELAVKWHLGDDGTVTTTGSVIAPSDDTAKPEGALE